MCDENGNVFIYILIGIILLAALNAIVSRSGEDGGSSQRLSEAKRNLLTDEIMLHASSAKRAVRNMQGTGTDVAFNTPSSDDFYAISRNSDETKWKDRPLHNLLHPKGGGLQHKKTNDYEASLFTGSTTGWLYQTETNVDWSEESGVNDIIIALAGINKQVCEEINKRITNSKNIPDASESAEKLFDEQNGSNNNFTSDSSGVCSDCKGKPELCIDADDDYVYYNILVSN